MKNTILFSILCFIFLGNSTTIPAPKDTKDVNFYTNFTLTTHEGPVQLSPFFTTENGVFSYATLTTSFPTIRNDVAINKTNERIKWGITLENIPLATFKLKEIYFDFSTKKPYRILNNTMKKAILFYDGLIINFDDLRKGGLDVFFQNETRLVVKNITIKNAAVSFDPTVYHTCGGTINESGYYIMEGTLECPGDGVYIVADDVDFDCQSYQFTWNYGYSVYAYPAANLKIHNCPFVGVATDSDAYGIMIDSYAGDNITIEDSSVTTIGDYGYNLFFLNDGNVTVKNTVLNSSGGYGINIYLNSGSGTNNLIENVTIYNNGGGYFINDESTGNILIANSTFIGNDKGYGVNPGSGVYGIIITSKSSIINSILNTTSYTGGLLKLDDRGSGSIAVKNSFFYSNQTPSFNYPCIDIMTGSKNSFFENNYITPNCSIVLENGENGCSNTTFLNTSYTRDSIALNQSCNSTMLIGWYGNVNTTSPNDAGLNASVNLTNVFGQSENYTFSGSSGVTNTLIAWQFFINATHTINDFGNHTIIANATGFIANQTNLNITAPFLIHLTLSKSINATTTQSFIYSGNLNDSMLSLILAMGFISIIFAFLFYSSDKNNTAFRLTFLIFTILSVVMMAWIAYATLGTTTTIKTYDNTGTLTGTNVVSNSNTAVDLSFQTYLELVNYLPYIIFAAMILVVLYNALVSYNQKYQGAT